jgi:replicative DNA helicase Mcm
MEEQTYTESALIDVFVNISGTGILQGRKYFDVLNSLTPNSTFSLNVMEDGIYKYFLMRQNEFKHIIKQAILKYLETKYADYTEVRHSFRNLKINLISNDITQMHDLNAKEHEQTTVTFDCEIVAVEKEKSYIKEAKGVCPLCFRTQDVKCDYERDITTIICDNIKCKKHKLTVSKDGLVTDNIQYIYVQQLLSDAQNSTPVMFRAVAVDELSGKIYVGQKKRITGMYKSVVKLGKEGNIHDIIIEIISVQDLEKKNDVCMTEEEIDKLKKASKEKDFTDKLTNSFAPLIIGYEDIKFSILLMLAGGYSTVKRNDINILLVGDPSLAKSELLKECSKISNKSMYTSGRGASAAGLTIGIVKMENGTQVAQAGVLPLCNEGHACIDEFDKMNPDDRSAMHEGMEQQTVSIAKAGFRMTLPAKASILAAANPKYGKYDIESSLIDNINIPVPLVSRFDLIWLIRDVVNVDEDSRKAQHVLDTFTGNDMSGTTYLDRDQLTSYLNYIREYQPTITLEAKQKLAEIYKTMRQLSVSNDSLAIGVRQLEALARLATAHAKILFKDKVEVSDVLIVEALLKRMFGSLGVNTDNKFSQATFVVGKKENKEQTAHSVWAECMNEKGTVMYENFVKKLGENPLFDENSAKKLFGNWEQQCVIKLNGDGSYRKL